MNVFNIVEGEYTVSVSLHVFVARALDGIANGIGTRATIHNLQLRRLATITVCLHHCFIGFLSLEGWARFRLRASDENSM